MTTQLILVALAAYAIGTFPTGYLLSRFLWGKDIRCLGDGNTGAENVYRHVGPLAGVVTCVVDIGKGALAVWAARLLGGPGVPELWGGVMAVAGHNWPIFLQFRGGKGAATAVGVLLTVLPMAALPLGAMAVGVLLLTRSSTAALAAFFAPLGVAAWYTGAPGTLVGYAVAVPVLVGVSHFLSLGRVPQLEEPRIWDQEVQTPHKL